MYFVDNYKMVLVLKDDEGNEWIEHHENFSMDDVVYYLEIVEHSIVEMKLKQVGKGLLN